ncbi:hypothetical protein AN220_16590, partial [Streptomyces nanshensis]
GRRGHRPRRSTACRAQGAERLSGLWSLVDNSGQLPAAALHLRTHSPARYLVYLQMYLHCMVVPRGADQSG